MFYDPVRLRTLARFSAPDPWSGNQLTDYSIEDFVMMPLDSKRALDSKWSMHTTGIQWEGSARFRLLPESLTELWKQGRIPAEKLPWLMHAIEPRLIETDCVASQSWQRSLGIPLLVMLILCPAVFLLIRVHGERMPAVPAIASGLLLALLTGGVLWIARSTKRSRVKEQMTWAMQRISATGPLPGKPATEQPKLVGPLQIYSKLWLKLFVLLLALMALLLCTGAVYFKLYG